MDDNNNQPTQTPAFWAWSLCTQDYLWLTIAQAAANITVVFSAAFAALLVWRGMRRGDHRAIAQLSPWRLPRPFLRLIHPAQPSVAQFGSEHLAFEHLTTQLRDATEALRVSERRRKALAEARGGVLWRMDEHGRIVEGHGWHALTGQPDSALLDGSWIDRVHPDDRPAVDAACLACQVSRTYIDIEHRVRAPDEENWLWVHAQTIPIFNTDGQLAEWFGSIENITMRRQAEERIRSSEALLRFCMEVGHIGTYQRDRVTGDITCGPETRNLHGFPDDDAPVSTETWESTILPEDLVRLHAEMAEAVAQCRTNAVFTYRIRHPVRGDIRHLEIRTQYKLGPDNAPTASWGVVIDVTKVRESGAMLGLCLEAGHIGEFSYDLVAGAVRGSLETRAIFGISSDQDSMPADQWFNLIIPDDRERIMAEATALRARQVPEGTFNYRIFNSIDKRLRHIEARVRYEYSAGGKLLNMFGVVIDITERREAEAKIAHLAHHDALTGLPNRVLFNEHLSVALARAHRGDTFALLCLDLDRFKEVNDTLGHPVGDALLCAVTARLQNELRDGDILARLGGDEFAIIMSGLDQSRDASALARRLVEAIGLPFDLGAHQVVIGVSIGIAVAPADGASADTLLRCADLAMYRSKADGRGCWHFFEIEMDTMMRQRRALEMELRRALEMQEFELFYQPIIDVQTRRVSGLEALIRWRHPKRGLIAPDAFVPLAEEIGLILPLGEWVLQRACAEAMTWSGNRKVAVNLSPVQFASRNIVDVVTQALASAGLPAERLELEITETVMLQETAATLATLHRLKALGVKIAMDDFGTGYSSLSYLQRFPFDKIKIDRSFTRELGQSPQTNAIVKAITGLCFGLEMTTTAEGVESEMQFRALQRKGCQEAQGFLFSRPRPAAEIPNLLKRLESDLANGSQSIFSQMDPSQPSISGIGEHSLNTVVADY